MTGIFPLYFCLYICVNSSYFFNFSSFTFIFCDRSTSTSMKYPFFRHEISHQEYKKIWGNIEIIIPDEIKKEHEKRIKENGDSSSSKIKIKAVINGFYFLSPNYSFVKKLLIHFNIFIPPLTTWSSIHPPCDFI